MADEDCRTPLDSGMPAAWPHNPASLRQHSYSSYLNRSTPVGRLQDHSGNIDEGKLRSRPSSFFGPTTAGEGSTVPTEADVYDVGYGVDLNPHSTATRSSEDAALVSRSFSEDPSPDIVPQPTKDVEALSPVSRTGVEKDDEDYAPIKSGTETYERPPLETAPSKQSNVEEDLERYLSRRSSAPHGDALSRQTTQSVAEEQAEINRLMSRMFGRTRQEQSEEEKTKHVGVVFKHLTVKGMGLGAALQPTFGDIFLGLPRLLRNIFTKGPRRGAGKPPIKTIINDFSGVIKPGEMCLVLGRPGSGCSTFLKVIGNQRFGYESVDGDVSYGGTDAHTIMKNYRGEVLYNPEDDLHYATLSVEDTLAFAIKCKTPGKESRNEGERAREYVASFLKAIVKLFWIGHTLDTKVGNEYVHGISGGEKKRVSIAEAMITKASTQCWDNSTRGLDANTALEYVQSLHSLTKMTRIVTAVALYQAGERLYDCFDKVLLIDEGRCAFFGRADVAAKYFKDLGFIRPERWTTADFLISVTDKHERHVKDGWENRIPRSADDFGDFFLKNEQHQQNLAEIAEFEGAIQLQVEDRKKAQSKATQKRNYTIPFYKQVWACTHRQFLVMIGDKQSLGGRWGGILFQALIVGSLFYNMPRTSAGVFERGGVLFLTLLFNALLALAQLTVGSPNGSRTRSGCPQQANAVSRPLLNRNSSS